jgi:DNA mismatch repair ATPase MutS
MSETVQIVEGKKVVSTELLKVIADATKKIVRKDAEMTIKVVGEEIGALKRNLQRQIDDGEQIRRDLQDQIDHLRDMQRSREVDWIDDVQELKRLNNRLRGDRSAERNGQEPWLTTLHRWLSKSGPIS